MNKFFINFGVGLIGTVTASSLHDYGAAFAGFGTGIYMLTQAVILVIKHRRK